MVCQQVVQQKVQQVVNSISLSDLLAIITNLCGGPEEVCPASCSQGHDHPVPGDQGPQGHGKRHLPNVLPSPGEGGRQEGGSLLSSRMLISDPFVHLNPF